MIVLDAATKALEYKLAGTVTTNNVPFTVSYIDVLDSDQSVSDIASGDGTCTGATAVVMVTGPAAGHTRQVKSFNIHNADTTGATITVQLNNNGTLRTIWKGAVLTLENLEYGD